MSTTSLTDTVYEQVLLLIKDGRLATGDRLPGEHALATRFAVSRPVVRQAMARLRSEGRVTAAHGAGHFVGEEPQITRIDYGPIQGIPDVRGFLEFRCLLEGESAALAARSRETRAAAGTISSSIGLVSNRWPSNFSPESSWRTTSVSTSATAPSITPSRSVKADSSSVSHTVENSPTCPVSGSAKRRS